MSEREEEAVRLLRSSLDQPGPARRISRDREAEIARAVCDEANRVRRVPPAENRARWLGRAAAAIAVGSALSAAAALGWTRFTSRSSAPAVSVVPARPAPPTKSGTATEHRPEPTRPPQPSRAPAFMKTAAVSSSSAAAQRGHPVGAAVPMDPLERANRLRAERRWREAADAYAAVVATGPPRAASVAAVARATLLVGPLHRPREALILFRRALVLAPTGPVSDEALYGIATSFRELGEVNEERDALRRLLVERPSSPLRGQAEKRLVALTRN